MPRLLHIESSPRKARSHSTFAAQSFIDAFREQHSSVFVDQLDLWAKPMPEFDQAALDAKYAVMSGTPLSAPQKTAWAEIEKMVDRIKAADVVLISAPMWNFSIPYKLKHYLDLIMQPGLSFGFEPSRGYFGLLKDKVAVLALASMGDYAPGTPAEAVDFQSKYLHFALNFIGITERFELRVAPTGAEQVQASRATATQAAKMLAQAIVLPDFSAE
jgi:FMN-dependent NADH-azoreductase